VPVLVANIEDSLLSKAFIMERERYDGGDIAHLLQANARAAGLAQPGGALRPHWRVLLAHLTLFGYIYPGERHRVPAWVMVAWSTGWREKRGSRRRPTRTCAPAPCCRASSTCTTSSNWATWTGASRPRAP
jgi:hypothetical protein